MTKQRPPLSLEKALVRIADVLPGGYDEMAEATRRRASMVRAWADPDKREQIPVRDAKLLDKACRAAGGGTPIFDHLAADLGAAGALEPAGAGALASHAAHVMRECGEAGAALVDASIDPALRARAVREVEEALDALKRALPMLIGREAYDRIFPEPEVHQTPASGTEGVGHQTGPPRPH